MEEYLIPEEILKNGAAFIGAYISDMLLVYQDAPYTHQLNNDMVRVWIC